MQRMICIRAKILWLAQRHHRAEIKSVAVCFEYFECFAEFNCQQSWNFAQHDFSGLKKLSELFGAGGGFGLEKGYCKTTVSEIMKQAETDGMHISFRRSGSLCQSEIFTTNEEVKDMNMLARILPM